VKGGQAPVSVYFNDAAAYFRNRLRFVTRNAPQGNVAEKHDKLWFHCVQLEREMGHAVHGFLPGMVRFPG
jgi:hypothetical protein